MPSWGPLGELTLNNIFWGLCHQYPCPHSELQPTPASPGDPTRPLVRSNPSSYVSIALCWVPAHVRSCVHPPRVESLFLPALWSSCIQAPLAFKAKCAGGFFLLMPDPQTVLEGYFYVRTSQCSLCVFNIFWCKGCF